MEGRNVWLLNDWMSFRNIEKYEFNIECNVFGWLYIILMGRKK